MRMDRYDEENPENERPLTRMERHQTMYENAYDNRSVVDINNIFAENENTEPQEEVKETKEERTYEEKNYDINDYLKKAHERIEPDKELRNINNQEFLNQEDEISRLIASIDEQRENDDFFSDLIGEDEDTMIEGQITQEELTKTTFEEFYADEVENKKEDNTKLEKALGDETISKLELDEENTNDAFKDILKTYGVSKKKKRYLAITIFSITLFMLIIVILIIILK